MYFKCFSHASQFQRLPFQYHVAARLAFLLENSLRSLSQMQTSRVVIGNDSLGHWFNTGHIILVATGAPILLHDSRSISKCIFILSFAPTSSSIKITYHILFLAWVWQSCGFNLCRTGLVDVSWYMPQSQFLLPAIKFMSTSAQHF